MNTGTWNRCLLIAGGILLGSGLIATQADYAAKVLAHNPVVYWRLNDKPQVPAADLARNSGSLGAAVDGYYVGAAWHPVPGALAAVLDSAAAFDASAGTAVSVPYSAAMNPSAAFSVEAWLNPNVEHPAGTLTCAISSGQFGSPRSGWLIYQSDTGWNFRMYNQNALATSVNITGGPAPVAGAWYHVVAVYNGADAKVYVNGVQAASGVPTGYVPSAGGALFIGGRADSSFWWNGAADEVAIYAKALTASEIDAHYRNGTSASPATPYNQLVLSSGPVGYYRLNEDIYWPPATLPVAMNLGSYGSACDGAYNPGVNGQAAGPRPPTLTGFEADNNSGGFNGNAGFVGTLFTLNDLPAFTVMGWIKRGAIHSRRGGYFGQNDLLELGDADGGANIEAWINAYTTNIKIPYPFRDDEWGLLTLVADGSEVILYANGIAAGAVAGTVTTYGNSGYNFNIGGGGVFNAAGDYFLGNVDEVAVFDKALTAAEVQDIYFGANIAPVITVQPAAPARDLYEGNAVTLSVTAVGTPPLSYQWRKGVAGLPGQTAADLVFTQITLADAGAYSVVVSNPYGFATSSDVTLTVRPGDTVAPTLQFAAGTKSFTGVRVWFSEPLDPVTAQNRANYQVSGGLAVTSATLSAPAGAVGDNIVDLATSAQTPGATYTLTVSNVKDQSLPGNPVAAGSTVQFSAWTLAAGFLTFEHYDNITGAADADIDRGLADPRVVAGTPTTAGYISGRFDTRTIFPDDSHEYFLSRITGWITPTETGDYNFFLRSDDAGRLYLSNNERLPDPAIDTPICVETDCCDAFQEPGITNDDGATYPTSDIIHLQAGRRYGVLALLKEHGGGDYLMVAWRNITDTTPAANLPYLPGQFLSTYVDPNVEMAFVKQPTDQVGVLASTGVEILSETFDASDGGFTVQDTVPAPPGPWYYDGAAGQWVADGGEDACTGPYNSRLSSPPYKLTQDGAVSLNFTHRHSFESDLYDGGQVRISVNGGDFTAVPPDNFTANGYADGAIIGNGVLLGQRAFALDSPGYAAGEFITSKAFLGTFSKDDTIVVQFLGAWDECAAGKHPNWVIDSLKLMLMPMIIQNFSKGNGGFTVQNTTPAPPGPWVYDAANGQWAANGGEDACTGPYNSQLNSPACVVPQTDEVTLSFTHRYSFEGDYWDGGQVRISVNGGAFTPVPADNFTANGYAAGNIQGTGVLNGQRAFNGDSPGYATGASITSSAILGSFNKNDTIVVQFVGAWDECSIGSRPSWVIKNLQLVFGKAAKAVTFDAEATASRPGAPVPVTYQWERNDGAGWVAIYGATNPSFRIFPVAADFDATFRLVASVPGKSIFSDVVKIVAGVVGPPTIAISMVDGKPTVVFTGKLESAAQVTGPWGEVVGAVSPYEVPAGAGQLFFRAAK